MVLGLVRPALAEGVAMMEPLGPRPAAVDVGQMQLPAQKPAQTQTPTQAVAEVARNVAVADGITTYMAVATGASELNPLVNPTPGGLLLLTGLKFGLVQVLEGSQLPDQQKKNVLHTLSALWGAMSANNVLVAAAVNPPVAMAVGVIGGAVWWWRGMPGPQNARGTEQD